MRQGQQHRRGRGRNNGNGNGGHSSHSNHNNQANQANQGNRKGQNPLTRSFESNGPDVKVRGTPAHVAEKYLQLARDANSSGDHVLAENYLQHAEHYNRIIFTYREQQGLPSGENSNAGGRSQTNRFGSDIDDQGDDMGGPDDGGQNDQPMIVRNPMAEQPRGADTTQSQDDGRPQRQNDHNPRFRDRNQRSDRPERIDRPERHERPDRPDQRPDRPERQSGYDRPERGFDRRPERPFLADQPADMRDVREPREPRDLPAPREAREVREARDLPMSREPHDVREPRETREVREPREPRLPREPRAAPREPVPFDAPLPAVLDGAAPPARSEGGPRRRERFGLGADHPDFLRRPVRRPRREPEPEAGFTADVPPLPPADEPTRE